VVKRSSAKYLVGQSDIPDTTKEANDRRVKEIGFVDS
jgi:hypothetical protein